MTKKRPISRAAAWLLLSIVLAAALTGCSRSSSDAAEKIARLEKENAELRAQLEALTARNSGDSLGTLDSWVLEGTAVSPEDPASIRFTAVPAAYSEGQTASLLVTLDGREEVTVPCVWDGSAYSAFLTLAPADGYGYYCILTTPNAAPAEIPLSTPDSPMKPSLTFLATSMRSFCNLFVEEWTADSSTININSAFAQLQMPLLTADGSSVVCRNCYLDLRMNGQLLESRDVTLTDGETAGSYTAALSNLSFSIPEMQPDDQLDLWLVAQLSDGQTITAGGGSWFFNGTSLDLVVG